MRTMIIVVRERAAARRAPSSSEIPPRWGASVRLVRSPRRTRRGRTMARPSCRCRSSRVSSPCSGWLREGDAVERDPGLVVLSRDEGTDVTPSGTAAVGIGANKRAAHLPELAGHREAQARCKPRRSRVVAVSPEPKSSIGSFVLHCLHQRSPDASCVARLGRRRAPSLSRRRRRWCRGVRTRPGGAGRRCLRRTAGSVEHLRRRRSEGAAIRARTVGGHHRLRSPARRAASRRQSHRRRAGASTSR